MRKIPVIINGNQNYIVGFLEIDEDTIPPTNLLDMHVSWIWESRKQRVMCMSLNPMNSVTANRKTVVCSNCKEMVEYGSQHARGTSEFDTTWICERNS